MASTRRRGVGSTIAICSIVWRLSVVAMLAVRAPSHDDGTSGPSRTHERLNAAWLGDALAGVMSPGVTVRAQGRPASGRLVAVHVANRAAVSQDELARAQQSAARIYQAIDVELEWLTGAAALAPADGLLHVDVVILSKPGTAQMDQADHDVGELLGRAVGPARRAYVYVDPVAAYARRTGTGRGSVLGSVMAHELGHLLLPAPSHTASGIMRGRWSGPLPGAPGFTPEHEAAIKARLQWREPPTVLAPTMAYGVDRDARSAAKADPVDQVVTAPASTTPTATR